MSSWHYALETPTLFILLVFTFAYNSSYHSTKILVHAITILKCVINEDVFMNVVPFGKRFSSHWF